MIETRVGPQGHDRDAEMQVDTGLRGPRGDRRRVWSSLFVTSTCQRPRPPPRTSPKYGGTLAQATSVLRICIRLHRNVAMADATAPPRTPEDRTRLPPHMPHATPHATNRSRPPRCPLHACKTTSQSRPTRGLDVRRASLRSTSPVASPAAIPAPCRRVPLGYAKMR